MSERHKEIAERGLILKALVGSTVHGIAMGGSDDRDYMGICIEPRECVIGLERFEQHEHRTARDRTGRRDARSELGDVDLVVYSLRKWLRLALQGNPTVLLPMFTPDDTTETDDWGWTLREGAPELVASRQAGHRFLGYLRAQRDKMLGLRTTHTNRPELIEAHGYDTKFAGHMVRLGAQGVEYLETGRIALPMREPWLSRIRAIRLGVIPKDDAVEWARQLEAALELAITVSTLPERPDMAAANRWLVQMYESRWRSQDREEARLW